jgi:predicted DNA-binding antitoxin AbrB/MazE fold protein
MNTNIAVVYERGVLRPLMPLDLPERAQLEIRIVRQNEAAMTESEKAYRALLEAGLIRPSSIEEVEAVSEEERRRVADAYALAGPLSELIIAERDER